MPAVQDMSSRIASALANHKEDILTNWVQAQLQDERIRADLFDEQELTEESETFLTALIAATSAGNLNRTQSSEYDEVSRVLATISESREQQGFTPFETTFSIISLKDSWVPFLQTEFNNELENLGDAVITVSKLIDSLGLVTFSEWAKRREELISRQSREILEISTPVVQMWEGVVVAPLIGTLDTRRAQQFTERLLESIVETRSPVAIVDITGVISIDTRTAQHLIEAMTAVKLLGAQVILTGVSPSIAQTLVHLGIGVGDVITRSSLAAGLRYALDALNLQVISK